VNKVTLKVRTKHRIRTLLLGIGAVGVGFFFMPVRPFGAMSLLYFGTWMLFTVGGIAVIWSALKPEKYQQRYCPHCGMETEQFLSGTNYEKGYKVYDALKRGESKEEQEAHLISHEYSCEKCRKKNVIPITRPAFSGICAKCGEKMRYNKSSWKWFCDNCQISVAALAPAGE
jgi:predicted RNA-binding Zn-ribbon protein involved in translation (DUF1610 family)